MVGRFSYLIWLFVFVVVPGVVLYFRFPRVFGRYRKTLLMAALGSTLFGAPWDFLAVRFGIWSFSPTLTLGRWFGGLPIEEFFFYIFVGLLIAAAALVNYDNR